MFAHLFKVSASIARSTGCKYQLILSDSPRPIGTAIPCNGARHGKQIAKTYNATPYNF